MPTLNITLPNKDLRRIKERAEAGGFRTPSDWARFLVERNIGFEESPKLKASKIISEMKKTGLYKKEFLRELKNSLDYADKTA